MIKEILYSAIIAAGLTACNGDYADWLSPQSNAAKEAAEKFEMTVQPLVQSIDFAEVTDDSVAFFSTNLQAGQVDSFEVSVLPATEEVTSATKPYVIKATTEGMVAVKDLVGAVCSFYGKAPTARTMNITVKAQVKVTTEDGTVTVAKSASPFAFTGTPDAPEISQHYYLIGAPSEWAANCTTMPFTHSDLDVYEDPVFTVTFPVANGDTWFAFADDVTVEKNDWAYVYGCAEGNGNNGTEGMVGRRNTLGNDGSFKVTVADDAKYIKFTINMMDGTYKIEKINYSAYFYEIGNESGWTASHALYGANADGKYQGYYYLNGTFKFKPNADNWDGDYEYDGEGKIADNGGDNCPDPGAGVYQIDVDLVAGTYALTKVNSITIVGNHNGWLQDDSNCHMTYNAELGCWEITTALKDGFKFAMNDAWAISWGGANGDPTAYDMLTPTNGKDLSLPNGEGTYKVQLYLTYEGNNHVVFTKQ